MGDGTVRRVSRRLWDLVEPLAASVYFAAEAQAEYQQLGLSYLPGYFCSRGACMGQVPGEVVAAAFAVFDPAIVVPAVTEGWSKTDATTVLEARRRGATACLVRLLGEAPAGTARATGLLRRAADVAPLAGRPIFAGLYSLQWPGDPMGDLWRGADLVREHRGDSHNAAWVSHGLDPVEITLLTELWWRMPLNSYVATRGWSSDRVASAIEGLRRRGLLEGDQLSADGESLRASVEESTDEGERALVAALGDDADELLSLLEPWAKAVVAGRGYPRDPSSVSRP